MIEYEVGDLVVPTNGGFVGVVFWKSIIYRRNHQSLPWYRVYWDDGDTTDEDGKDIKLLTGGEV